MAEHILAGDSSIAKGVKHSNTKHGMRNTREYTTWIGIKNRCYNPKSKDYPRYGGRGIKVCDRWLGSEGFQNFFADMGKRPPDKDSIDRKNNEADYSPENCEWSTVKDQCNNRRSRRTYTYKGRTQTQTQWAEELGIKVCTLWSRINELGMSVEEALSRPVAKCYRLQ